MLFQFQYVENDFKHKFSRDFFLIKKIIRKNHRGKKLCYRNAVVNFFLVGSLSVKVT